ncbi:MAG: hypothetical protein WBV55_01185 [Candidatus Sulfotelmatobacter sp.]
MRRLLIVIAVLAFCSALTWADTIELDVNAWATFTATQPCSSNCTETIGVNFLVDLPNHGNTQLVPNSVSVSSSGFLGSFSSPYCTSCSPILGDYIAFYNNGIFGDEIDLMFAGFVIPPGINTLSFDLFTCVSSACQAAYGSNYPYALHPNPTIESSVVTAVAVPDGTSFLSLALSAFGTVGLGWLWRRRAAQ